MRKHSKPDAEESHDSSAGKEDPGCQAGAASHQRDQDGTKKGYRCLDTLNEIFPAAEIESCIGCSIDVKGVDVYLCELCLDRFCQYCITYCSLCLRQICGSCSHPHGESDMPVCLNCEDQAALSADSQEKLSPRSENCTRHLEEGCATWPESAGTPQVSLKRIDVPGVSGQSDGNDDQPEGSQP